MWIMIIRNLTIGICLWKEGQLLLHLLKKIFLIWWAPIFNSYTWLTFHRYWKCDFMLFFRRFILALLLAIYKCSPVILMKIFFFAFKSWFLFFICLIYTFNILLFELSVLLTFIVSPFLCLLITIFYWLVLNFFSGKKFSLVHL